MSDPVAVVLAAGKGTRMQSDLPKVLVEACGRPLVEYVLDAISSAGIQRALLVVGYRQDEVRRVLAGRDGIEYVIQGELLGTGHAVQMCEPLLADHEGPVVVLTGDSPLVQPASITALLDIYHRERPACILGTAHRADPTGWGRIVRDADGDFVQIVEEKDASAGQRAITEVNLSTYVFDGRELFHCLAQTRNDNRQGEYYVTDGPGILKAEGKDVRALPVLKPCEALSINTLEELAAAEAEMKRMGYGA
jgi:bifunctional UDP-N-acetylglucosamine pyrophosphorylase/glucosamine-1-phosphate N-acetyltransferase/UDP-N-acetylglucosamine pyrophosphorylase